MEKQINDVVKIVKCNSPEYWYRNSIGSFVEVVPFNENIYLLKYSGFETMEFKYLLKSDCEFMYKSDDENWTN